MAPRLYLLSGSAPVLAVAARDAVWSAEQSAVQVWRDVSLVLKSAAMTIGAGLLLGPLIGIIVWAQFHDERLRQRIARDGCPYAADADVHRVPGARELEFRNNYCQR